MTQNDIQKSLLEAVSKGDVKGIRHAVNNGADVSFFSEGYTALFKAVQQGHMDAVNVLLELGANPNKALNGSYPLHVATQDENKVIAKALIDHQANLNAFNAYGFTPLSLAVMLGKHKMVQFYTQYNNLDVEVTVPALKDSEHGGRSLLQKEAENHHPIMFKLLGGKHKTHYEFSKEAIDEVALITMIKNEEDIIFENLVWHFALGFRKFIIANHNSTDGTMNIVNNFIKLTKDHASVELINVASSEYVQSETNTASYKLVSLTWPEVKWVFPVDADEFWTVRKPLKTALNMIPDHARAINVLPSRYVPASDYYSYDKEASFYDRIHYRHYAVTHGKVAVQAGCKDLEIVKGNHYVESKTSEVLYVYGNDIGLGMVEFQARSPNQVHAKYSNLIKTDSRNPSAQNFITYVDQDKAGETKFNESFVDLTYAIDNPLPIGEAREIFCEIVDCK